jgi:hypothetical protein
MKSPRLTISAHMWKTHSPLNCIAWRKWVTIEIDKPDYYFRFFWWEGVLSLRKNQ